MGWNHQLVFVYPSNWCHFPHDPGEKLILATENHRQGYLEDLHLPPKWSQFCRLNRPYVEYLGYWPQYHYSMRTIYIYTVMKVDGDSHSQVRCSGSGDGHPSFPGGIDLYIYISFSPFHSTPQKSTSDFQNHEQWKVLSPKDTGFYHPYKWRFWASHGVGFHHSSQASASTSASSTTRRKNSSETTSKPRTENSNVWGPRVVSENRQRKRVYSLKVNKLFHMKIRKRNKDSLEMYIFWASFFKITFWFLKWRSL